MVMRICPILFLLLSTNCVWSFEESRIAGLKNRQEVTNTVQRDDERCRSIDREKSVWTVVSSSLGAIAGTNGIVAIPVEGEWKQGLIIGASIAGIGSVITGFLASERANTWVKECQ
jgi:predicted secreted protein